MSYRQIQRRLSRLEAVSEEPGRILVFGMHWPLPEGISDQDQSLRIETVLANEKIIANNNDLIVVIKEYVVEKPDRLIRQ